jgi:hypothetical protein
MSAHSSPASEGSTTDSTRPGSDTSSSASPTPTDGTCSEPDGPECPSTTTYALSENQRGELLLTDVAHQLTSGGGKPGQGYPAVFSWEGEESNTTPDEGLAPTLRQPSRGAHIPFIFSAEGSPARTCPSPDNDEDSQAPAAASSTSSPASPGLFDLDGYSSRTYPDCSPRTAVGTSESCLERWPTSGTAWRGGFSTAVTSECRSAVAVCSSSEPALTEILEPPQNVPAKYSLSARAAQGILRRAEKRGRALPSHLLAALEQVARTTTTDRADG